ncbi:MAG: bifunctional 4-hydroxy-2-oxoglutarate aldolase/2-dehydro-3-deoxy-phosphogluconate aldolase, partial [Gemmataceae bacterium]
MTRTETLQQILDAGIVAVVRFPRAEPLIDALGALAEGGVTVAEVTMTVPGALDVIRQARKVLGNRVVLGAGTILDPTAACAAVDAGAQFLVSPMTDASVIEAGRKCAVPMMAGAFTPTEIFRAWQAGSDVVKVFPAECLGPAFFRAMRGPLPQIPLMPTGGVDRTTAAEFLKA